MPTAHLSTASFAGHSVMEVNAMSKKKQNRLTRVVSYLHRHKFLDESCFEDGEITEDDFLEGGEDDMTKQKKEMVHDKLMDAFAVVTIVGGCAAFFVVACGATYYSLKGTANLFKAIGKVGSSLIKR